MASPQPLLYPRRLCWPEVAHPGDAFPALEPLSSSCPGSHPAVATLSPLAPGDSCGAGGRGPVRGERRRQEDPVTL